MPDVRAPDDRAPDDRSPDDRAPDDAEDAAVALRAVTRAYDKNVVLGPIDLDFHSGERVVVIGPSGSGKSTLLRLVAGSLAATSGSVLVSGVPLDGGPGLRAHRRSLGIVAQGSLLVPQLSAHRNVLAGALPHWPFFRVIASMLWPLERAKVRKHLAALGIESLQWRVTSTLSGGEAQRVAVARALYAAPTLVIADEPTASLDPSTAETVTALLLGDATERGATLIMSTHWVSLIDRGFDRVLGIRGGRLVLDSEADAVTPDQLDALYAGSDERR